MAQDGHSYSEVWKSYEEHPLTHSMAHYILAIAELREERGYARITDVARRLGVTKGSASIAIRAIKTKGFVTEDENRMLLLTKRGQDALGTIVNTRSTFLKFFHNVLGLDEHLALEDACKLEHLVSRTTSERLMRFVSFLMMDARLSRELDAFRENVASCRSVDACERCDSIDECAVHLVERITAKKARTEKKTRRA